ncbi:GNAT family N-acetyltransferase [Paenibacillus dakarensis]|uniref:GNAT family N-acetyltransferase n=1 Tax=Paenibacillus dakarensis TaxID=1527293 RepID=UPI0006D556E7|nr:GNAT family N-acetyltransferase [Paenibacillus dakarensis]
MSTSQQTVTIRFSEMKDASKVMELDDLVWDKNTTPAPLHWKSRDSFLLHSPPGSQLLAVCEEDVCGYIGFRTPTSLESNEHVLELNIAIHPAYQRQGLGRRLMQAVKDLARLQHKTKLRLRVLSSNPGAVAFYKKCGFHEEGRLEREFFVDGHYVDDILMSCFI